MDKKSPFGLSFEEMAGIGERAFADAAREAKKTGLNPGYIDVAHRDAILREIAEGQEPGETSRQNRATTKKDKR